MSAEQWPDDPAEQKRQWMDARASYDQAQSRLKAAESETKRLRQANADLLNDKDKQKKEYEQKIAQYASDVKRLEQETQQNKKQLQFQEEQLEKKKVSYADVSDAT